MLNRIQVVDIALLILISLGDKGEVGVIRHASVRDLQRVFHTAVSERVDIIAGRRDAHYEFVLITLHRLFESVVLSRYFEGREFVGDGEIAVKAVLFFRVTRHDLNIHESVRRSVIRERVLDGVFKAVVMDIHSLGHSLVIKAVLDKVECLKRLFQCGGYNIRARTALSLNDGHRERKRSD